MNAGKFVRVFMRFDHIVDAQPIDIRPRARLKTARRGISLHTLDIA